MAAFVRTQNDGTWLGAGYVPLASDWADIDSKFFRSLNGDRGGTWAPSTPITFFSGNIQVTGLTKVAYGGELRTAFTINHATYWPEYAEGHPFRERALLVSMLGRNANSVATGGNDWMMDGATFAVQSVALSVQSTGGTDIRFPPSFRVALRVHDGATLKKATFSFRVPSSRTAAPVTMPRFRIVRADAKGTITPLASAAVGADADGWMSPTKPTSGAAWYASGLAQAFAYTCDQNNVIDKSQYTYWAEVFEEGVEPTAAPDSFLDGVLRREQKAEVRLATATTPGAGNLTGPMTIDGIGTATGDRILVKDGYNATPTAYYGNGIWIANDAGLWTRATDLDDPSKFTKRFFVRVREGSQNTNTFWECTPPYPQLFGGDAGGRGSIFFARMLPSGNKYHSVLLDFDGIVDMRFQ